MAHDLFAAGRLAEALAAQQTGVEQDPDSARDRLFLIELLLYSRRLPAARAQLPLLPNSSDSMRDYVGAYARLLDAEAKRLELPLHGEPTLLVEPTPGVLARLEALRQLQQPEPDPETLFELMDEAQAGTLEVHGHIDGRGFDEIRNLDDLLGPTLEVLLDDQAVWVPLEVIRILRLDRPQDPRDRLFRPAHLTLTDGREFAVHLPTVYARTPADADPALLLGEETDCLEDPSGMLLGVGGQMLLVDDAELNLHEFHTLEIRTR